MEAKASDSYPAAADHSNSTMKAQASDSYPAAAAAAADHSNSAMEAQAIVAAIQQQQLDHSNSAMEAQASGSYPAAADHIATVLWKCRLVAAIQQLYKLLYKSCIEAKQNNAQV